MAARFHHGGEFNGFVNDGNDPGRHLATDRESEPLRAQCHEGAFVCDKSHRHAPVNGLTYSAREEPDMFTPSANIIRLWFVRTSLADPSEHLSRHAPLWALLR